MNYIVQLRLDYPIKYISVNKDKKEEYVLAWTTTPWTLSSNVLLAVNPELGYVKTKIDDKNPL